MRPFTTLISLCLAVATIATPAPTQLQERQLAGIPSIVCLTGELSSIVSGLLSNISIIECTTGETCAPLPIIGDLPIVGSLLPIGVSFTPCIL